MEKFDNAIRGDIKKWSYPIWFVIKDNTIDCPCKDPTTHQPDPNCRKCFGTGKKVKIRRMNAAHQNNRVSVRGDSMAMGEIDVISVYYTLKDVEATEEDLVLDGDTLDSIQHYYPMRSDHSDPIYYKYETAPLKTNRALILKNLKSVLRGAGYHV